METSLPLITVITVTYNCANSLEPTIRSVSSQSYPNIEYIIIDGVSNDGTLDIIKRNEQSITHWISESDRGIYNAMNKGIALAKGEWINFLNAGDIFESDKTIEQMFANKLPDKVQCIYGDYILSQYGEKTYIKAQDTKYMRRRISFCHQSSFLRNRRIFFDESFKICADYAMFREILEQYGDEAFVYRNMPVAIYDGNGISSNNNRQRREENMRIQKRYNKLLWAWEYVKYQMAKVTHRI